jgi:hypothetical protein
MKKRIIAVLVLVLLAVLLWLCGILSNTNNSSATTSNTPTRPAAPSPNARSMPTDAVTGTKDRVAFARDLMKKANRPIQFFGKVIDQNNNPIPEVRVTLEIRVSKELAPNIIQDVFDHPVLMTDADGRFALTDSKGALLGVQSLEKAGYEPSEKGFRKSYWYWRDPSLVFHPDANRPEIFRMWKQAGAEKLVRKGIGHAIPYNSTPTSFDLIEGRAVASNGDLRVTLARSPQQIQWGQRNYDWTVTIEAVNGGLIASADEQMYRAPVEGYQPKLIVHMPANDPNWTDSKDVAVYLKLRGGKYYGRGELKFMVGSDRPTTPFSITSFINPSGSRNLEYDPQQTVVPAARP